MGSSTPFGKDILFMKGQDMTRSADKFVKYLTVVTLIIVLIGVGLAMTTGTASAAMQTSADDRPILGPPAPNDRPIWQDGNSPQNMYENYLAWTTYTNTLDAEVFASENPDQARDLLGEAYSVTAELALHYETQPYPTSGCGRDHFWLWTTDINWFLRFYGALYYNTTADVGEPIDQDSIINGYGIWVEFAYDRDFKSGETALSKKCWNKLDW